MYSAPPPHRTHMSHMIHNEHTINHHISQKISTGKNGHTGHHTVLLNHKRTPHQISPEEFPTHGPVNKGQQYLKRFGTRTHGRLPKSVRTRDSSSDLVITLYNMQNVNTWFLWTKVRLRNLIATHGFNTPKQTNEIGNTHKQDSYSHS
jgi:hypothetical protein